MRPHTEVFLVKGTSNNAKIQEFLEISGKKIA